MRHALLLFIAILSFCLHTNLSMRKKCAFFRDYGIIYLIKILNLASYLSSLSQTITYSTKLILILYLEHEVVKTNGRLLNIFLM